MANGVMRAWDGTQWVSLPAAAPNPGSISQAVNVNFTPTGSISSVNVQAALAEVDADRIANTASITSLSNVYKTVKDYGAVDDGVTDCTAAFQAAINSGVVIIPATTNGFRINSPLNATNRDYLYIKGFGAVSPSWDLAYELPKRGSWVKMNTGGYFLDITGSNNVTIEDVTFTSTAQIGGGIPSPSVVGIIGGTSSDNSRLGSPGGTNYYFKNVTVAMANSGSSIPMYFNNINTCKFINTSWLGKYGMCIVSNNPLGATPPFTSFGTITASDGNIIYGGMGVSYGDNASIYLENANDITIDQTYLVYANGAAGKVSYTGVGYAIYLNNCQDVHINVEEDYFPYLFHSVGHLYDSEIKGIAFAGPTATPVGAPIIGFFAGDSYRNCKFNVAPIGSYAVNNNYHYSSNGGGGSVTQFYNNCDFWFDAGASTNAVFLNVNGANAVPFFNCNFRGTADKTSPAFQLLRNGAALGAAEYRYFMNGNKLGSA